MGAARGAYRAAGRIRGPGCRIAESGAMIRWFAVMVVLAVTLSSIFWMAANPLDSYWDEAGYHAAVIHHARAIRHNGFSGFVTGFYFDPFRPPANDILAL